MTLTHSYLTTCAYALALRRASLTSALALLLYLSSSTTHAYQIRSEDFSGSFPACFPPSLSDHPLCHRLFQESTPQSLEWAQVMMHARLVNQSIIFNQVTSRCVNLKSSNLIGTKPSYDLIMTYYQNGGHFVLASLRKWCITRKTN